MKDSKEPDLWWLGFPPFERDLLAVGRDLLPHTDPTRGWKGRKPAVLSAWMMLTHPSKLRCHQPLLPG